jgi:hypothetical protein
LKSVIAATVRAAKGAKNPTPHFGNSQSEALALPFASQHPTQDSSKALNFEVQREIKTAKSPYVQDRLSFPTQ